MTKNLSSKSQRQSYTQTHGKRIYPAPTHADKISLLKRAENGESITRICSETGISRTIFYKWLCRYKEAGNRFESLQSNRPTGDRHYRHIKGLDEAILAVIARNPHYSLSQILSVLTSEELKAVSRSGVYKVLKKFDLTTPEARFAYLVRMKARTSIPKFITEETLPDPPIKNCPRDIFFPADGTYRHACHSLLY